PHKPHYYAQTRGNRFMVFNEPNHVVRCNFCHKKGHLSTWCNWKSKSKNVSKVWIPKDKVVKEPSTVLGPKIWVPKAQV
ncbi:hypothetical protein DVA76_17855, partial [Acinetobacter baumannii]